MFYYYCPKCGFEERVSEHYIATKEDSTMGNLCGSRGIPLYHYKCANCGNPFAGALCEEKGDMNEKVYYRSIISLHQPKNEEEQKEE